MDFPRGAPNLLLEAMMLALVVAVAVLSSWAFDQSPLNWINVLFVLAYLTQRAVRITSRHGSPAER